jgi:glycosyltransferase involved in cell wall biosynthesis
MKIAIIHDWLVTFAGAEQVLAKILDVYPGADLFSVIDFFDDGDRIRIGGKRAKTTFIQKLPFAKKYYRAYLPLMPLAIEQLDMSGYDLIISSSHAVAKGVITGPDQMHVCYVHSPIRYAWDMQHQYLRDSGLNFGFKSIIVRYILHKLRMWDVRTSNGVDHFIANSKFVSKRIKKVYGRNSVVIYPPVNVARFELKSGCEDYYIAASRLVPYKKIDIIAQAFSLMPSKKLIIVGDGPEAARIKAICSDNIHFLGYKNNSSLVELIQGARAFVFAAEEDFGILPVEAQACGTPVIAFAKGGALETVVDNGKASTGVFFNEQTPESICEAVERFESMEEFIDPVFCRQNANRFDEDRFKFEFLNFITKNCNL